ncbi:MAG: hypothetical protein QOH90_1586 [Actinomycetota bacterium]|jgi:hypothetical protein|nr:hypothetical protein [Actinomycetota bacterium]
MRRAAFVLISALFLLVIGASLAGAQLRDPFQPVASGDGNVQPAGPDNSNVIEPGPGPANPGDGKDLPFTGSDSSGWVVLSYGLIAAGVTSILVARARRPISLR